MINRIVYVLIAVMCSLFTSAQAPQKMSYQVVVRNSTNAIVANQQVGVKISLLQGSATSTAVFEETHTPTTNANGLASLVIGDGTVVTGNIANINWANGPYFIKTETDPTGGMNYSITGTSQLLSVPYALYAENAKNIPKQGKVYIHLKGNITNADAVAIVERDAGPMTQFLIIDGTTNLTSVDISSITNLAELYIFNNQKLASVQISSLVRVDSKITVQQNNALTQLSFPNLETFEGSFDIRFNPILPGLNLPSFVRTTGAVQISSNPLFSNISMPVCEQAIVSVNESPLISTLSFPSLNSGSLIAINCSALGSVSVPSLVNGGASIIQCNEMVNLSFPNLVTGGIYAARNTKLVSVSAPLLDSGQYWIESNPILPSISVPVLRVAQKITITGNPLLTSLSFPSLTSIEQTTTLSGKFASLQFPQLKRCKDLLLNNIDVLNALSFPELKHATAIKLEHCTNVATVSFAKLDSATQILIDDLDLLTGVSMPQLIKCDDFLLTGTTASFNQLHMPLFREANRLGYYWPATGAANLVFPALKYVNDLVLYGGYTSVSLPLLDSVKSAGFYANYTSLSLPSLKVIGSHFYAGGAALTSISLPALHTIRKDIYTGTIPTNSNPNYNGPLTYTGDNFKVGGYLTSLAVNAVLAKLVSIAPFPAGCWIQLKQVTAAPPTGQGLIDKATLQSQGHTVRTD